MRFKRACLMTQTIKEIKFIASIAIIIAQTHVGIEVSVPIFCRIIVMIENPPGTKEATIPSMRNR